MATSGTTSYAPALTDLALEVFERVAIRAPAVTTEHYASLRRSMNLVQSRWSNRGINLWKVELDSVALVPGTATFALDAGIIDVLDVYLNSGYGAGTGSGESYVTDGNGVSGGIIDSSGTTVTDGTQGFNTAPLGGLIGGGGSYFVDGNGNPLVDSTTPGPTIGYQSDILLSPLSRSDYAAIPNKMQQGRPTSYWFNKATAQSLTLWPVPNAAAIYTLNYYVVRQMQDATATGSVQPDVPFRMLEAYVADVAAHMSIKWSPDRTQGLAAYATATWAEASSEDTEQTPLRVVPMTAGYWR